MLEMLFLLDKLVITEITSLVANPVTMFSGLCGLLLAAQIYSTEKKNKGRK